jgi:hypothetical protein
MVVLDIADGKTVDYALSPGYLRSTFKPFCDPCRLHVNDVHSQGRQNLWMDFAEVFGLKTDHNLWDGESVLIFDPWHYSSLLQDFFKVQA